MKTLETVHWPCERQPANKGRSIQKDCKQHETFTPDTITLSHASYESMVRTFRLPFRAIESTAVVGPFFWSTLNQDDEEDPCLRMSTLSSLPQ
jgi:hypothetical protein